MIAISSAAQCRALDADLIERVGIPGIALMELASRGLADAILERFGQEAREHGVLVLCGPGNNGGDGFGCARWLARHSVPVRIFTTTSEHRGDSAIQREAARAWGIPFVDSLAPAGVVVDALFGTGLSRPIGAEYARVLETIQRWSCVVVAADVPSGLDADTGECRGPVVGADLTVTFGRLKPALFTSERAGEVVCVDIGVDPEGERVARVLEAADVALPARRPSTYKTREGHLGIVAGSPEMAGAAILASRGALAAGVGLVTLHIDREALPRLGALPPEVMVDFGLPAAHDRYSAIAVGPGLGGGRALAPSVQAWVEALWKTDVPKVFDADALLSMGRAGSNTVITPHPGEAGRLLQSSSKAVQADRFGSVRALHRLTSGVVVLKGRHTLVQGPDELLVNPTGAATLATGGSGDVLTGVIGGLLARGIPAVSSAWAGVWAHGRAGEALQHLGSNGWTASDIAVTMREKIAELEC